MKVILSRKGFDSGYGGFPSPVLPDGTMLSLPIPVSSDGISYSKLLHNEIPYSEYIKNLVGSQLKIEGEGKFDLDNIGCHLDPDIRETCYPRLNGWHGIFGQNGSAQSHLKNKKVEAGDLFLYFGWFRKTIMPHGKLIYDPMCKGFHAIYGYLQVGKIERINQTLFEDWSQYHPHVLRGSSAFDLDHLYTATDYLSFSPEHKGYGVFELSSDLILTKSGYSKSRCQLPDFMQSYKISYHSEKSWKADYFQSAAKGQEFVMDCDDRILGWLGELLDID